MSASKESLWPPVRWCRLLSVLALCLLETAILSLAQTNTGTAGGSGIVRPGSIYQTAEFSTPYQNGSFYHMVVSEETHDVFIGAVDYLYRLDQDLHMIQEVKTGPKEDNKKCPPPVDGLPPCTYPMAYTNNVNKILVIDTYGNSLVSCGTIIHGYCERRSIHNISALESPHYGSSVASSNASASTVAFIAPGPAESVGEPQPDVLYVSVSWSKMESIVEDIPAVSSRNLTDFTLAYEDIETQSFPSTSLSFENQQKPQFPVKYVYGFSSGKFSYMLAVQRKTTQPNDKSFHTVAIRVCQNDKVYDSYVEVPLNCTYQGVEYNILEAAYLAQPGRNLAMSLGTDIKKDVLFALFSVGDSSSSSSTSTAQAMCVFEMKDVVRKFTENIKRCFEGTGTVGGGHLGSARACTKNQQVTIDDDYCGEAATNELFAGTLPINGKAVLAFPAETPQLSSIRVATTHDYTVAFVGTVDGKIMKVSVESNSSATVYETLSLLPNQPIKSDMRFDDDKEHLYIMSQKKVIKLKVQDCTQYTSCSDCLGAGDPYCGWCSLENKCSQVTECQGSDSPKRWLSYDRQECPKIVRVIPKEIARDKDKDGGLFTLEIHNLPDQKQSSSYKCVFSSLDDASFSELPTRANRSGNNLQCYAPKTAQLPDFGPGKDSVTMKLSVQIDGQELVHETVTFFDCDVHSSCTSCTMSAFPCTWCIKRHICTDNTDQHCNDDVLITGKNRSGTSVSPGPEFCPRFDNLETGTEILIPVGSTIPVTVKGHSLQDFQRDDLRCQFNINSVMEVSANVGNAVSPDGHYEITCEQVKFEYFRDASTQKVPLKIVWGNADNPLDNPKGVLVVMYRCRSMASTCGECITLDPKYNCGWCGNSSCTTDTFCQGSPQNFHQKGAICPNPHIDEFSPVSGPLQGGTLVTIHGQNLGTTKDEVQVMIDMVSCTVINFKAPDRIICKTEETSVELVDSIRVIVGRGKPNPAVTKSVEKFAFVKPRITDIAPILGPYAGGTLVTIRGEHLDAGSNISVFIGQKYPCTDARSINATAITCTTTAVPQSMSHQTLEVSLNIDNAALKTTGVVFTYKENPNVTWVSRQEVIRSGGLQINASGEYLHNVQSPGMLIWYKGVSYLGACKFSNLSSANITCTSPLISGLEPTFDDAIELEFGFKMDDVEQVQKLAALGKIKVHPDPVVNTFPDGEKTHQPSHEILFINGKNFMSLTPRDVKVYIGKEECVVTSVVSTVITCEPPTDQPAAVHGSSFPEVTVQVGQNLTYNLGILRYEKQDGLSEEALIAIICAVSVIVLMSVLVCIFCCIKSRRNDDMMKKMKKEMDQLESRVANECKEAFAELQTDMSELTSDLSGGCSIPFWDYRTYCMRILFPPDCNDHPVIRELELDYRSREEVERGLKLFFNLIKNKTFLLIFIRTLEANKDFSMKERVNVASLISVCLQTQMEYATEILKTLLAELIEKTVENPKVHPKILLRRNESVAEKMLTNWFTFLLYKFLRECAGEPLFMLFGAIKQQVSKGPVDSVTGEARYSLSEDKLIRQHINYKSMVLYVMDVDVDRCSQPAHPVKVLDCDTISQVKDKILDALYKSAPFSSRPPKEELDLVLFDHPPEWIIGSKQQVPLKAFPNKDTKRLVLSDDDHTTKWEGDCKRLNTLSHYKVPDGAYVALHPKQTSIYNMSIMSEKSKYSSDNSYYNRSPSLNRSLNPPSVNNDAESGKVYHLVRHQDAESNNKEGERGSKMVSEIYLPRLLVTKGTLQTFVDDLFERIFSTAHRGTALPLAIKYMFDFLDDQALHHNQGDEVVHIWKSNSLPLRYWVNVIKNPNFAFDIYKSNIVDACLTVIGQTFMDCCSILEHKLTKDSPSGKLLYAKDIPKYKKWVVRYYQDIKIMPAISDQDMTAMLAEESRTHQNEFNTNAALLELYKYVKKHYDDIMNALEDDEFAKKSKLTNKLEQVSTVMDSSTMC